MDNEDFAFETHDDVVRVVRLMEENLFEIVPKIIWASQTDQLGSAVRNHVEQIGYDMDNQTLLLGMLYGTLLTINLESQLTEVSPASVMLASVLLGMVEDPNNSNSMELLAIRNEINRSMGDEDFEKPSFRRWVRRLVRSLTQSITG